MLQKPGKGSVIPAESDCHQLLTEPAQIASIRECATATGQYGTVTGTEEGYAHSQVWSVWKRAGNNANLVLTYSGNIQSTPGFVFHAADLAGDGDTKLLAVEYEPQSTSVTALDIIESNGTVVAHIGLASNGEIGPADPGVRTWSYPNGSPDAQEATYQYIAGAWRRTGTRTVPVSQVPSYPDRDGFGGGLP